MAETVLVTGGTGFVAGWQIVDLLRRGYAVRATVRDLRKADALRAAVGTEIDPGERLGFAAADLMADDGWEAAVAGVDQVLHVATAMGVASPDPEDMIRPAVDGTLRVLKAATAAGVKRVLITSSTAACATRLQGPDSVSDETQWTDLTDPDLNAYRRSKTLAERAAWDFMAGYEGRTALTTVLPSAIFGPVLSTATLGSVMVVGRILSGKMPGNPRVGFSVVDVRDLAAAQTLAMASPKAAGERLIATNDFMWMAEIAKELKSSLGARAAKVSTLTLPDPAVRLAAKLDANLRNITLTLGRRHAFSSAKAQAMLDWRPRPGVETVVDCAESLLAHGVV